ncbi:tRNA (adenosine(37)-N6)-dimethylallyltransferase MiaA [Candidatus Nomurabacteria bacterium]|nr:tRNA (adenosine(37)-N6)-dimethylallyltransferase MiaA [Candidatus Nomurabacteria bacterium]
MQKPKVIAIVGPTASGKTSLSIDIAKKFNGEVISADSRQVYTGLNIGSGKVTTEEMDGVPHHLLDVTAPTNVYTAADWQRDAQAALLDIQKRGLCPVIAGGSFFYLDQLRGKSSTAPVEPNEQLRGELELLPAEALFEKLQIADPARAETIDAHNKRRIIRALEIVDALGSVPTETSPESPYDWLVLGVDLSKETLHSNIHIRLIERMKDGMVDEAKRLHAEGVSFERMNDLGLEYRYLAKLLKGELPEDEMVTELETKIRQFAKRQMTWLKRDDEIEWYAPKDREAIFRRVAEFLAE